MRIIEPHNLKKPKNRFRAKNYIRYISFALLLIVVASIGLGVWIYRSPLPKIPAKIVTASSPPQKVTLKWPGSGQSAVGAVGYGFLASNNSQRAVPIASVAKVITALAVLQVKPLSRGQNGPIITLNNADVDLYNQYLAMDGSVVAVQSGEQISEYQALQAIMLPSANNIADSLAIWAFGSLQKYYDYANNLTKQLGMKNTNITSASGFSATTVSTADDLILLGEKAVANPVLSDIVSQTVANLPVEGQVSNVNSIIGQNGIDGIKTGNTDEAGGCYLVSSSRQVDGHNIKMIAAVLGSNNLGSAMRDSLPLLDSAFNNFQNRQVIAKGDVLGYYDLPWNGQVKAVAASQLAAFGWNGQPLFAKLQLDDITDKTAAGSKIGTAKANGQTIDITIRGTVPKPSLKWRLMRWF